MAMENWARGRAALEMMEARGGGGLSRRLGLGKEAKTGMLAAVVVGFRSRATGGNRQKNGSRRVVRRNAGLLNEFWVTPPCRVWCNLQVLLNQTPDLTRNGLASRLPVTPGLWRRWISKSRYFEVQTTAKGRAPLFSSNTRSRTDSPHSTPSKAITIRTSNPVTMMFRMSRTLQLSSTSMTAGDHTHGLDGLAGAASKSDFDVPTWRAGQSLNHCCVANVTPCLSTATASCCSLLNQRTAMYNT
jgi:hypothetical protein